MNHLGDTAQFLFVWIDDGKYPTLIEDPFGEQSNAAPRKVGYRYPDDEDAKGIGPGNGTGYRGSRAADARENPSIGARNCSRITAIMRAAAQGPALGLHKNERDEEGENIFHGWQ